MGNVRIVVLQHLDMSWNAFGSSTAAVTALSGALGAHPELLHLDLSHNQLNAEACAMLSTGLNKNHTLLGLHMGGNAGVVDPRGYLATADAAADETLQTAHIMTRIIG